MDIQLSAEAQRFIEAQLQLGEYRSASEVIEALVEAKKASKDLGDNSGVILVELAARQRRKTLQAIEECEALAVVPPEDKLTNRDHDQILYGERL
jgi:Arc/MetJ-type ribon-helix-helix transcriptional regulator